MYIHLNIFTAAGSKAVTLHPAGDVFSLFTIGGTISLTVPKLKLMEEDLVNPQ